MTDRIFDLDRLRDDVLCLESLAEAFQAFGDRTDWKYGTNVRSSLATARMMLRDLEKQILKEKVVRRALK